VPGVFEHSPFPGALNGSLWSLPYEVKMYIVLALGLAVVRYNLLFPVIVFVSASLIAALSALGVLPELAEGNWWINFSTLFFTGSMVAAAQSFVGLPLAVGALIAVALAFVRFRTVLIDGAIAFGSSCHRRWKYQLAEVAAGAARCFVWSVSLCLPHPAAKYDAVH
jgi:peptidoglycan/LPS O-acetylase OafA/YrhL